MIKIRKIKTITAEELKYGSVPVEEWNNHEYRNYLLEKLVLWGMTTAEYIGGVNYFYTDTKCNGCGICERVCLSKKIKMTDNKPIWQKNPLLCVFCLS
jgi:ferredoxin